MALGLIEVMALIVIALASIKIIVLLIKPKAWVEVVDFVYARPSITSIIALILGGWVLLNLLEVMSIVQIFAVMLFFMLLMALSFAVYEKETVSFARKMLRDKRLIKKGWLPILIWIVLMVWALKEMV